jgi:hypothetical protein
MLKSWTIRRASSVGIAGGLATAVTAALFGSWPAGLLYPYAALLALTAFCGASILWITLIDTRRRARGERVRPIRAFDVAIGLALFIPAAMVLKRLWPELG